MLNIAIVEDTPVHMEHLQKRDKTSVFYLQAGS